MAAINKDIIVEVNDALARNDAETFLRHCADDFSWTMVGEPPVRGKKAVREWLATMPADPPKFSVDALAADGDMVVAQGRMTMKQDTGVASYAFCDVWRFRGNQIAELNAFVIQTEPAQKARGVGGA